MRCMELYRYHGKHNGRRCSHRLEDGRDDDTPARLPDWFKLPDKTNQRRESTNYNNKSCNFHENVPIPGGLAAALGSSPSGVLPDPSTGSGSCFGLRYLAKILSAFDTKAVENQTNFQRPHKETKCRAQLISFNPVWRLVHKAIHGLPHTR